MEIGIVVHAFEVALRLAAQGAALRVQKEAEEAAQPEGGSS